MMERNYVNIELICNSQKNLNLYHFSHNRVHVTVLCYGLICTSPMSSGNEHFVCFFPNCVSLLLGSITLNAESMSLTMLIHL